MILEKSDLENDRTLDEQLPSLEPATILLENDLFDAYINSNGYVVDWIDDQIQDDPCQLLKALRDNWTRDGVAMRTVYMKYIGCLLYTSPSPRDRTRSRMPSSA